MQISKSQKLFATLGLAAITTVAALGAYTNPSQESVQKELQAVNACVQDVKANLHDLNSLHKLSQKQEQGFKTMFKNIGDEALDMNLDPNSSVSDGQYAKAVAKKSEKLMLGGKSLDVEEGSSHYENQVVSLCSSDNIRQNVIEARRMIEEDTSPKIASIKKNKPS